MLALASLCGLLLQSRKDAEERLTAKLKNGIAASRARTSVEGIIHTAWPEAEELPTRLSTIMSNATSRSELSSRHETSPKRPARIKQSASSMPWKGTAGITAKLYNAAEASRPIASRQKKVCH